jgi:Ca-activated chloride channel family protein
MMATDVKPTRLAAAEHAALRFLATVPKQVNVGVMEFNQKPQVLQSPTTDRQAVAAALSRMNVHGFTAAGEAIATATAVLNRPVAPGHKRAPAAIVLLSDGKTNVGRDPVAAAQAARKLKIPVYTVSLGTPNATMQVPQSNGSVKTLRVPPDPAALAQIAKASARSLEARKRSGRSRPPSPAAACCSWSEARRSRSASLAESSERSHIDGSRTPAPSSEQSAG